MSELTENPLSSFDSYDDYLVLHKPLIIEKLMQLTNTDPRMNDSQRKGFFKAYHDLVPQEPTLEEMDLAYKSYVAHFDHIPSVYAFVKHFNRFRTGILPNKRGQSLKQLQETESNLKMEAWIKEMEENEQD